MAATIVWSVVRLDCTPTVGEFTDVVQTVHWRCIGTQQGEQRVHRGSAYGACTLPAPVDGAGDFIPYASLTEQQVLEWCWANGVDKAEAEASVQRHIDIQMTPPVVQPPLPWA